MPVKPAPHDPSRQPIETSSFFGTCLDGPSMRVELHGLNRPFTIQVQEAMVWPLNCQMQLSGPFFMVNMVYDQVVA